MVLGHEITGEVIETGRDVEFIKKGDIVSVPFNIACGRCVMCRKQKTHVCLNDNPDRPGSAYGYVDMGGWVGGQSEYVMVPYADFQLLVFPDKEQALEKILDLTMLSDIFPTGFHGACTAGVQTGSTVYIAGAGPVGLAAAHSAQLLGASTVIVGDLNEDRLAQARSFGCETVNVQKHDRLGEQIEQILGEPTVDAAVDCVGFEASGHGNQGEAPAAVLNSIMGCHPGRRKSRYSRLIRDRRSRCKGCGRQNRLIKNPLRTRLGQSPYLCHRTNARHDIQPQFDESDPERQSANRKSRQRYCHFSGRRAKRLQRLRQRRSQKIRHRPAWNAEVKRKSRTFS